LISRAFQEKPVPTFSPRALGKDWIMLRPLCLLGVLSVAAALGAASAAEAQTSPSAHSRAAKAKAKPSGSGRQITVRKGESYLTLGGTAGPAVTSTNNYVLDTFSPPVPTQGTFTGMRGRERLDNRFDGPGIALFRF